MNPLIYLNIAWNTQSRNVIKKSKSHACAKHCAWNEIWLNFHCSKNTIFFSAFAFPLFVKWLRLQCRRSWSNHMFNGEKQNKFYFDVIFIWMTFTPKFTIFYAFDKIYSLLLFWNVCAFLSSNLVIEENTRIVYKIYIV